MKICNKCKAEKPLADYRKSAKSKDGFYFTCRVCMSNYEKSKRVLKQPVIFELPVEEGEIWKPIKENPDYLISNKGRVYSSVYFNGTVGRLIKHIKKAGYPAVGIHYGGKQVGMTIHRLIGEYFIPNPDNKPVINHINGDINDFRIENLEWANHRENSAHGFKNKGLTSEYTGVCWYKWTNKWAASIRIKNKLTHLGYFTNEEDAAKAYEDALINLGLTNKYSTVVTV